MIALLLSCLQEVPLAVLVVVEAHSHQVEVRCTQVVARNCLWAEEQELVASEEEHPFDCKLPVEELVPKIKMD